MANLRFPFGKIGTVAVDYWVCDTDAGKPVTGLNVGDKCYCADTRIEYTAISSTAWSPSVVSLTGRTASIAATSLGLSVGLWRVGVYHICTFDTLVPATPGALATTIRWTDNGAARSAKPAADIALDYVAGSWAEGQKVIHVTSGTPTYETVVTPPSSGAPQYSLFIRAELIGT